MYPITCRAGFAIPIKKAGRCDVLGVSAVAKDTTLAMRLTLVDEDSFATISDTAYAPLNKPYIADLQGDTMFGVFFEEPIKVRNGVNVVNCDNCDPGKIFVYVR